MSQGIPLDPNRTMAVDPMRTQAMTAPVMDMNRTTAMAAVDVPTQGIAVAVTPSREATMANGPAREQFLIEIAAGSGLALAGVASSGPRTALNLCLVIDRSGSMEGPPLDYVKHACSYVVDMLSPNDVLSIVTFAETVDVLMAPQRVTSKEPIKAGIQRLQPGNTTNLYDALTLATQQLVTGSEGNRATRMVVLSDGDPTAGIKDFSSLVAHAGEVKARGITATFLGFGPEYNEELLAGMAKKAGGNYYYIPQPNLIPEIFRTELEKLISVEAQNIQLELKFSRWVNLRAATGHTVTPGERAVTLMLSDLERGATIQQMIDLEFTNHPLGHYRVAAGKLTFDDTSSGQRRSVDVDLVMEFTADSARFSMPANPKVSSAAEVAAASRAVERTVMGLKTGQFNVTQALGELQKTQALLIQDGRVAEAQEVTMAMRALQSGDAGGAEKTLRGTVVHLDQGKR
jgi:Ca-activated chloride channel family protein